MANIQVDDILAGTPQCKTKVRAPSAPTTAIRPLDSSRVSPRRMHARPEERGALHHGRPAPRGYVRRALQPHGSHEYHQGTLNTRQAMPTPG